MFLGYDFLNDGDSFQNMPTRVNDIKYIDLEHGVYDDIFISKNPDETSQEWNFDTIIHATFNGNLYAGNLGYAASEVTGVRIKRRKVGTYDWTTIFDKKIDDIEDINFEHFHKYARNNTKYEFAVVPMLNNLEGNLNINTILSEFNGDFVMDKEHSYHCIANMSKGTFTQNSAGTTITTLGSKYPYTVKNGENNYTSGTYGGLFAPIDDTTCNLDLDNKQAYNMDLLEWLVNGDAKLIKYEDGRMFIISVVGNPSEAYEDNSNMSKLSFEWVCIGDCDNALDLYNANLIDIDTGLLVI